MLLIGDVNDDMLKTLLEFFAEKGPISIELYSGGGDLTTGLAMADLIKARGNVTITATGLVGSAAVVILAAASKRFIRPSAAIYLHPPTHSGEHTHQQLTTSISNFRREVELYINLISKNSKLTREQVLKYIQKDTYLNADQSVRLGLVNAIKEDF